MIHRVVSFQAHAWGRGDNPEEHYTHAPLVGQGIVRFRMGARVSAAGCAPSRRVKGGHWPHRAKRPRRIFDFLAGTPMRQLEAAANGWKDLPSWVFCDTRGGLLDPDHLRSRVFYLLLRASGLRRIRFHDLRHTFASLLLQQGESPVYVKEQMGHSSIQITVDLYGHLIPGGNKQAVDRLDGSVDKASSEAESATQPQPDGMDGREERAEGVERYGAPGRT